MPSANIRPPVHRAARLRRCAAAVLLLAASSPLWAQTRAADRARTIDTYVARVHAWSSADFAVRRVTSAPGVEHLETYRVTPSAALNRRAPRSVHLDLLVDPTTGKVVGEQQYWPETVDRRN